MSLRKLGLFDLNQFKTIRLDALKSDPTNFISTYNEEINYSILEWQNKINYGVWFGFFADNNLVAIANLLCNTKLKIRHTAEISSMYVDKNYRGKKIASFLLNAIQEYAIENAISQLHLGCNATNINAINLYRKFGFKIYGTRPNYTKFNNILYDDLIMIKLFD